MSLPPVYPLNPPNVLVVLPKIGDTPLTPKQLHTCLLVTPVETAAIDFLNQRTCVYVTNGRQVWSWLKHPGSSWGRIHGLPQDFTTFTKGGRYVWKSLDVILREWELVLKARREVEIRCGSDCADTEMGIY